MAPFCCIRLYNRLYKTGQLKTRLLHFIRRTHMVPLRCTKLLHFIWHTHIHVLYKAAQQCQQRWSILSHTHMCAHGTTEHIKCTVGKEKCTTDEISAPFYQTCTHCTRLLHWSGTLNLPNISAALFYQTHTPGCIVHKIVQQKCNTIQNVPNIIHPIRHTELTVQYSLVHYYC